MVRGLRLNILWLPADRYLAFTDIRTCLRPRAMRPRGLSDMRMNMNSIREELSTQKWQSLSKNLQPEWPGMSNRVIGGLVYANCV